MNTSWESAPFVYQEELENSESQRGAGFRLEFHLAWSEATRSQLDALDTWCGMPSFPMCKVCVFFRVPFSGWFSEGSQQEGNKDRFGVLVKHAYVSQGRGIA